MCPALAGTKPSSHRLMENFRMVRVGNRVLNLSQITFAEYSPAFTPPPVDTRQDTNPAQRPITYTRPEPKLATLVVHFASGEAQQFHGELADELYGHFSLLV